MDTNIFLLPKAIIAYTILYCNIQKNLHKINIIRAHSCYRVACPPIFEEGKEYFAHKELMQSDRMITVQAGLRIYCADRIKK